MKILIVVLSVVAVIAILVLILGVDITVASGA
jgi:hypothetical protein